MDTLGNVTGLISCGNPLLANLPFMFISFYCVKWTVDKLNFRQYVNHYLLFTLISLPNFCIWKSILSKETIGLVFNSIFGVLFINKPNIIFLS